MIFQGPLQNNTVILSIKFQHINQKQLIDKMLCSVRRTAWRRSTTETINFLRASLSSNLVKSNKQKLFDNWKQFTSSRECRGVRTSSVTVKDSNENESETIPVQSPDSSVEPLKFHDRQDFFKTYPAMTTSVPRQAWIESLEHGESPDGMVVLHPDVWGIRPRVDILWDNIDWQKRYKTVKYNDVKERNLYN